MVVKLVVYCRFDGYSDDLSVEFIITHTLFDYSRVNDHELFAMPIDMFFRAGGCELIHTEPVRESRQSDKRSYSPTVTIPNLT